MGSVCCCCLHVPDEEEAEGSNGSTIGHCICPVCLIKNFISKQRGLTSRGGKHPVPPSALQAISPLTGLAPVSSSDEPQGLSSSSRVTAISSSGAGATSGSSEVAAPISSSERNQSCGQTLPNIVERRDSQLHPNSVIEIHEKESGHLPVKSEPGGNPGIQAVWSTLGVGSVLPEESCSNSPAKSFEDALTEILSEDEDVCPTCLEEYTAQNPKIVAKCSHDFHLGCIYEWMERSPACPKCNKLMEFNETN